MTQRGAAAIVLVGIVVVAGRVWASPAGAAGVGAMIAVTPANASVGDVLRVDLSGWPEGLVTAAVCGNAARRASTDCDQIGAGSIHVPASGTEALTVTVQAPPVGCPCVVRASTTAGDVVRTAPITIAGVPGGVDLPGTAGPLSPAALHVTAEVVDADVGWPASWYPAFAGPAQRELVLTMHNRSLSSISGLRVVGEVGRTHSDEGTPLGRAVAPIPAGESRTVRVPFTLAAPVWGTYLVHGSIYGLAAPIVFRTTTKNEPWALELGLPLVLLVIAQLVRRRERRRAEEATAAEAAVEQAEAAALAAAPGPTPFPESSPAVGSDDLRHWGSDPYHQPRMGPETVLEPTAPPPDPGRPEAVLAEGRR